MEDKNNGGDEEMKEGGELESTPKRGKYSSEIILAHGNIPLQVKPHEQEGLVIERPIRLEARTRVYIADSA